MTSPELVRVVVDGVAAHRWATEASVWSEPGWWVLMSVFYVALSVIGGAAMHDGVESSVWFKHSRELTNNTLAVATAIGVVFWPLLFAGAALWAVVLTIAKLRHVGAIPRGAAEVYRVVRPKKVAVPKMRVVK